MNKVAHLQCKQTLAILGLVPEYDNLIANLASLFIKFESQRSNSQSSFNYHRFFKAINLNFIKRIVLHELH